MLRGKRVGRHAADGAVWSPLVVFLAPVFDEQLGLGQRAEPVLAESVVAQRAIESFDEGVLRVLARLDVVEVNTPMLHPLMQSPAGELPRYARPSGSLRPATSRRSVPPPASAAASRR